MRKELSIPEYFAEVVAKTPEALAVTSTGQAYTYASLDQASNQIAGSILHHVTEDDESIVLLMDRSALAVTGLLSILKTGKICIPLSPVNNEARMLDSILNDHHFPLILTDHAGVDFLQKKRVDARAIDMEASESIFVEEIPRIQRSSDDYAMVIYTSGSTGSPKGVVHTHRNILSRVFWYRDRFNVDENDRTLMLSAADSISGIVGIMRPLVTGGRLHMFSLRREGFQPMADVINEQNISILPMVNSVFRYFTNSLPAKAQLPSIRLIILGGEATTIGDVELARRNFSEQCLLINTLGCTELPTYRYFVVDKNTSLKESVVPAGYGVPGNHVEIVDANDRILGPGDTGEIIVKSKELAFGYWKRPLETNRRFFKDKSGMRCYRTGDLGRMRENGVLEHMGRQDGQVKIIGNRIELAEIEDALREHPNIVDAAASAWSHKGENKKLYANVVYKDHEKPNIGQIKNYLRSKLPDYMVPTELISVSALPLTRTGKVNRRALTTPSQLQLAQEHDSFYAPHSGVEKDIAEICAKILNLRTVNVRANLFDLGANSLVFFQIIARLNEKFDVNLTLTFLFDNPSVEALTEFIKHPEGMSNAK